MAKRLDTTEFNGLMGAGFHMAVDEVVGREIADKLINGINSAVRAIDIVGLESDTAMSLIVNTTQQIVGSIAVEWRKWTSCHELYINGRPSTFVCQQFSDDTFVLYSAIEG